MSDPHLNSRLRKSLIKRSRPHKELRSFVNYENKLNQTNLRDFQLDRVRRVLASLGNPQQNLRIIHVAGTKGKGSTCVLTAHILAQAGYRVGLYTSPHLYDVRERIRILQRPGRFLKNTRDLFPDCISQGYLQKLLRDLRPHLKKPQLKQRNGGLTYFEVLTVCALWYFEKENVDVVVLETGLGGRLDATNVTDPLVFGMTPISLDHMNLLGDSMEKIAREKAAIFKRGQEKSPKFAVIAPQAAPVKKIIERRCKEQHIRPLWIGRDLTCHLLSQNLNGQRFRVRGQSQGYVLSTGLLGEHQRINAATAIGLVESLKDHGFVVDSSHVRNGVARAFWPGRFEILRENPCIILDAAHNPSSSEVLTRTIRSVFPGKKVTLILGVSNDKDYRGMSRALNLITKQVILTSASHPRARDLTCGDVKKSFSHKPCFRTANVPDAMDRALRQASRKDIILITGSIFVVSEARKILTKS